jgi:hypothetical protein
MDILIGTITMRPYVFAFFAAFLLACVPHVGWQRTLTFTCALPIGAAVQPGGYNLDRGILHGSDRHPDVHAAGSDGGDTGNAQGEPLFAGRIERAPHRLSLVTGGSYLT